jgi:hypothetical protein
VAYVLNLLFVVLILLAVEIIPHALKAVGSKSGTQFVDENHQGLTEDSNSPAFLDKGKSPGPLTVLQFFVS